jgi:hypothetical protein
VQTIRIATQPFPLFLDSSNPAAPLAPNQSNCAASTTTTIQAQQQQQQQQREEVIRIDCSRHPLVRNAQLLESLAAKHGIPLVALGSSSDPQHLQLIPDLIAATKATSCTFALPQQLQLQLAQQVAGAVMKIAALTGMTQRLFCILLLCFLSFGARSCCSLWVAGAAEFAPC